MFEFCKGTLLYTDPVFVYGEGKISFPELVQSEKKRCFCLWEFQNRNNSPHFFSWWCVLAEKNMMTHTWWPRGGQCVWFSSKSFRRLFIPKFDNERREIQTPSFATGGALDKLKKVALKSERWYTDRVPIAGCKGMSWCSLASLRLVDDFWQTEPWGFSIWCSGGRKSGV